MYTEIELGSREINDDDLEKVLERIKSEYHGPIKVILWDNEITIKGLPHLTKFINENQVVGLDISINNIKLTPEGHEIFREFTVAVAQSKHLQSLNLSGLRLLGDEALAYLVNNLIAYKNKVLQTLRLNNMGITDKSVPLLMRLIEYNPPCILYLDKNELTSAEIELVVHRGTVARRALFMKD